MMFAYVRRMIQESLVRFGPNPRATMQRCLSHAVENGLKPATVIDVGVAGGTTPLYKLFPDAEFILVEPLEEFRPRIEEIVKDLKSAHFIRAAAASSRGNITFNVHPDLEGSSMFREEEDSNVNGVERTVPTVTLDEVCAERKTKPPYLIKIDTQGSEIEVLKGAGNIMPHAELITMEVSLFEFYKGAPLISDCIEFMLKNGFAVYDLFDLRYRRLDGAMSQVDIVFVKDKGPFRKHQFYANREQRAQQDREFGVK